MTTHPRMTALAALWTVLAAPAIPAQLPELYAFQPGLGVAERFGYSVAAAGDFDGDCFDDVAVGAPFHYRASGGGTVGRVLVYSGRNGRRIAEFIGQNFGGASYGDLFGFSVGSAGDFDADGVGDLVVGAPQGGSGRFGPGYIRVYSGRSGGLRLHVPSPVVAGKPSFGVAVGSAGDFNGDGYDDVLVGSPGEDTPASSFTGAVRVLSGEWIARTAAGATPATAQVLFTDHGTGINQGLGYAVHGPLDANGDGVDDFVVGSTFYGFGTAQPGTTSGVVVYSGRTGDVLHRIPAGVATNLGYSVCAAGDVDGDGRDDFAACDPTRNASRGIAHVYSGASGLVLNTIGGSDPGETILSVAGAGDLDGDGRADFVVGRASYYLQTGTAGSVTAYRGDAPVELWRRVGRTDENLGWRLASAGDLLGSGGPHVVAGAARASAAYVLGYPQPYLGSGDQIYLTSSIENAPLTAEAVKSGRYFQRYNVHVSSPLARFHGVPVVLSIQAFPAGFPPAPNPVFPYFHFDPAYWLHFVVDLTTALPPGGATFSMRLPMTGAPVRLYTLRFQAVPAVLDGGCAFDAVVPITNAHEVHIRP